MLEKKKQKLLEFLSESTGLEAGNTSVQYLNNGPLGRERTLLQSFHFNYYSVHSTITLSATRAVMQAAFDSKNNIENS